MVSPEVESRPWREQLALDDAHYRTQLAYIFDRSTGVPSYIPLTAGDLDKGCSACHSFEQPNLDRASDNQAVERLHEREIRHSGVKDRGFMDSIYFEDPLGLLIELSAYRFEPPAGYTHADVLLEAHKIRVARGDYNIDQVHLADAIEGLVRRSRASLSEDRSPSTPTTGKSPMRDRRITWLQTH
jgi:hypothetical protein